MMPATCVPWPQSSYFVRLAVDEVHEGGNALAGLAVGLVRSSCHGGDAGVDDGDADAGAGVAILQPRRPASPRLPPCARCRPGLAVVVNALDVRIVSEALEHRVGNAGGVRLEQPQLAARRTAAVANAISRSAIVVKLDDDIGFAIAIGATIELLIELGMLPELGRALDPDPDDDPLPDPDEIRHAGPRLGTRRQRRKRRAGRSLPIGPKPPSCESALTHCTGS